MGGQLTDRLTTGLIQPRLDCNEYQEHTYSLSVVHVRAVDLLRYDPACSQLAFNPICLVQDLESCVPRAREFP